jgi:hypothetical protein
VEKTFKIATLYQFFDHFAFLRPAMIKSTQMKFKGSNQDCGGYQVSLEMFYPGVEKSIQKWIANF